MSEFNVASRHWLNVSVNDGPTVTVKIEVSTEGEVRVFHDYPIGVEESIYVGLFKERRDP